MPVYPKAVYGIASAFSAKHGLFSVGGKDGNDIHDHIYNLCFDITASETDLKWNRIGSIPKGRCYASCVMIQNKNDKEALFVVGGQTQARLYTGCNQVHLYEVEPQTNRQSKRGQTLKGCNISRYYAGIEYNGYSQTVYIGGGSSETNSHKSVEYYEVAKNEWFKLPDTINDYSHYPAIWLVDQNILHIGYNDCVERIDLRDSKSAWTVIEDSFTKKFGIKHNSFVQGNRQWMIHC